MKKFIAFILSMTMLFTMSACSGERTSSSTSSAPAIQTDSNDSVPSDTSGSSVAQEPVQTPEASSNVLIVYYSYSGVTEGIAQTLQEKTGGDLYEIEVVEPYPDNNQETSNRAAEERESGNLPALQGELPVLDGYDVILVGGPVWTSTLATPVMSYLEQTDFSGKTVASFWTDAGNPGNYAADFPAQAQNGEIMEGLGLSHVVSYEAAELEQELDNWLSGIGLVEGAESAASEISITVGDTVISAELNDSEAAREFAETLPVTVSMTRMGEHEYYGSLDTPLTHTEDLQTGYTAGDLARRYNDGDFWRK